MRLRIRPIDEESQFCERVRVEVITQVVGLETIQAVLAEGANETENCHVY
jgi:hypothetical protein